MRRVFFVILAAVCAAAVAGSSARARTPETLVEAIVLTDGHSQVVEQRIAAAIPEARFRWRYSIVLDGMTVVVPKSRVASLIRIPGVTDVQPSVTYGPTLYSSPGFIGAPILWGTALETAGNGVKIGIIDDGLDRSHPFFAAAGFPMPVGYPKGQRTYTSGKVIVARAFAPRTPRWRHARKPFDPQLSGHATHVAGIAAGNHRTGTGAGRVSGVAPRAYIGNYKVLTIPTASGFGLNGNSPEIIAGIETAVRDGMDVINLSIGEAEINPTRDLVALALNGAAAAGVVPVVAAGNEFPELGGGSVTSPGSALNAITVAAESISGPTIASFSSAGPTPMSHRMKPDVTAPGESIVSSVPRREGLWAPFSGTSMAAPHVAGAAALLRQRHPTWTVAQLKSALVQTGNPVFGRRRVEVPTTREGGGSVNLPKADAPLLFAEPSGLSFGLLRPGTSFITRVTLSDAGGGGGAWSVTLEAQATPAGTSIALPPTVTVPGELNLTATAGGAHGEATGHVVLTRGAERRRIPYWFRVAAGSLFRHRATILRGQGTYRGNTRGRRALVNSYRYPDDPSGLGIARFQRGPEQVFRIRLTRPAANLGVAITARRGRVEPRIVLGDENRLLGSVALPYNANPYMRRFQSLEPVAGVTKPGVGIYDIVFDSPTARSAGRFTFRLWIGDTTRPRLRLVTTAPRAGGRLVVSAVDRGSGVNPRSIRVQLGARLLPTRFDARRRQVIASLSGVARGRRLLQVEVADYQESKNQENVARILPNTGRLRARVTVR